MKRYSKRASLNISINAIVIIVLAMTFLGLGLTFIRGMFRDITSTTTKVSQQIEQQILDDLRRGDKKLSFPQEEITIDGGDETVIAIGIKNTEPADYYFCIRVYEVASGGASTELYPQSSLTGGNYVFYWDDSGQHLNANDANVYGIKLFTSSAYQGTQLFKMVIYYGTAIDCGTGEYTSKTFFVKVT